MNPMRYVVPAMLGAIVTLALLLLMHTLIATSNQTLDEGVSLKIADITMPETEIEANVREHKPEKVEDPEQPPPPVDTPEQHDFDDAAGSKITVNMAATPKQEVQIITGISASSSDGEYLPIVKVAPIYPNRAQTRGITGYCIVEYTIS